MIKNEIQKKSDNAPPPPPPPQKKNMQMKTIACQITWHPKIKAWALNGEDYSKTCLKRPLKKKTKTDSQCRSKVLQNAPREHSAILSAFIKLPFVFKTLLLSIFEWLLDRFYCITISYLHISSGLLLTMTSYSFSGL